MDGRVQVSRSRVLPLAALGTAFRPVGASGVVTSVLARAMSDQGPLPALLIAATR